MDVWQLVLYGAATFLALRVLIGLIETHRQVSFNKLSEEYNRQAEAEQTAEMARRTELLKQAQAEQAANDEQSKAA